MGESHKRFDHIHIYPTPCTGVRAFIERSKDSVASIKRGDSVSDRRSRNKRVVFVNKQTQKTAQRCDGIIECWTVTVRAFSAKARNGAMHKSWIASAQNVVAKPQALHDTWTEILQKNIGIIYQTQQGITSARALKIKANTSLPEVDRIKASLIRAKLVAAVWLFDLDNVGSEVCEKFPREWAGNYRAQIEYANIPKNRCHHSLPVCPTRCTLPKSSGPRCPTGADVRQINQYNKISLSKLALLSRTIGPRIFDAQSGADKCHTTFRAKKSII